ncbi:uncharacterized protein L199_001704 [Kwoniella botswanensis]|uniref:uncharacterized protein n=1 Tax=Kwoniella botswanensis TaxID=1268659 RepID=UPI00315DD900
MTISILAIATSAVAAPVTQGPGGDINANTLPPLVSGGVAVSQGQIPSSINTAGNIAGATAPGAVGGVKPGSSLEAGVIGGQSSANSQDLPPSVSSKGVIASAPFPTGSPSARTFAGAPCSVHTIQP